MNRGHGRKRLLAGVLGLMLTAGTFAVAPAPTAHASLLNSSLLWYSYSTSPNADRATVSEGIYHEKGASTLAKGWTSIAVSRDTMLLYNYSTGAAAVGSFTGGVYTKTRSFTLPAHLQSGAASCDSVVLLDYDTQTAIIGKLTGGDFKKTGTFSSGNAFWAIASCDTLLLYEYDNGLAFTYKIGNGAVIGPYARYGFRPMWWHITATDDSVFFVTELGLGAWGTLKGGKYVEVAHTTGFPRDLDAVGGTATSLVFYKQGGSTADVARLVNGSYTWKGTLHGVNPRWNIITGGK